MENHDERFVYLMRAGSDHYKVGISNNIKERLKNIQTSNAMVIKLVVAVRSREGRRLESKLHKWLEKFQAGGGSEWFILTPEQALSVVTKMTEHTTVGRPIMDMPVIQPKLFAAQPKPEPKTISEYDELIDEAAHAVMKRGRASASYLQRHMRVGYARAARILDELEKVGVIGPQDGARAREVLFFDLAYSVDIPPVEPSNFANSDPSSVGEYPSLSVGRI